MKKLQDYFDRLVIENPQLTAGEIFDRVAPKYRLRAGKYLRWPPGVQKPSWADRPPSTDKPQRTRAFSPLTKDLEARLATARAKTKRSVPTGRVDTGAPSENPSDPPEGGSE